jgi:glycosyltransferase involved in cell wall biosynthesis
MIPVSVVIPCFRCAGVVGRALDSVLAQTARPLEIIVVDDGSGDGSADALRALQRAAGADRVRVLTLEVNRGPAAARNAGWRAASGEYVAFLDADDAWHACKIERQYGWMRSRPEAVLTGHPIAEAPGAAVDAAPLRARRITPSALLRANRFQTSSVMLRRSIPERFAEELRYCEDYALWLEIVLRGGPAYALDASLAVRFKPVYGGPGLSGRLWKMQAGELQALSRLRRSGLLGWPAYACAAAWSCLKFGRRVALRRPGRRVA